MLCMMVSLLHFMINQNHKLPPPLSLCSGLPTQSLQVYNPYRVDTKNVC